MPLCRGRAAQSDSDETDDPQRGPHASIQAKAPRPSCAARSSEITALWTQRRSARRSTIGHSARFKSRSDKHPTVDGWYVRRSKGCRATRDRFRIDRKHRGISHLDRERP